MSTSNRYSFFSVPFTSFGIHLRREFVNRRKGNKSVQSRKIVLLLLKDGEYWTGWTLYYWPKLELI